MARTIQGDLLQYADAAWLRRLLGGIGWLRTGTIVSAIVLVGGVLVVSSLPPGGAEEEAIPAVFGISAVIGMIVGLVGCWSLTSCPSHGRRSGRCKAARWLPTAALAGLVGTAAAGALRLDPLIGMLIGGALLIAGFLAILAYLRELAARIPDAKLARQCSRARLGAVVLGGFFAIWLYFLAGRLGKHLREILREAEAKRAR